MGGSRTIGLCVCAVSLSLGAPSPGRAEVPKLGLPQLIELARARHKAVAVAASELTLREAQKHAAKSLWFPIGEATYAITGAPAIQCRGPNNDANPLTRTQNCVNTVNPNNGQSISAANTSINGVGMEGQLHLLQPIYTFGKIESAIHASEHGIEAARAGIDGAMGDAEVDVTRAYWATKGARASVEMLGSVRDEIVPWIDKIQKNLDTPKPEYNISDLQRLKTALDELDIGRAELERLLSVALAGLRAIVGEEVDVDEAELDEVAHPKHPIDYYEDNAFKALPEVRQLDAGVNALRSLARLKRSEMMPDIGIIFSLLARYASSIEDADSAFVWHGTTTQVGIFLGFRQPLDLFERHAQMKIAQAEANILEKKRDLAFAGISFAIREGYAALQESDARLQIAQHGQKTARGWLNAVKQNMDMGTAETRDLTDSARQYIAMRLKYFQAIADFNIAVAKLKRLSGER